MPYHSAYQVVEPHPSTSTSQPAFHTGRGGAGNVARLNSSSSFTLGPSASGPSSITALDRHVPKTFKTGRGGAGNIHQSSERAIFSFDEELERQMRRESVTAPVYHVGRGGAGNMVYGDHQSSRQTSRSETGSMGSADSNASDGVASRARRSLEKSWGKIVGH
jgi:hypothetical protein